MSDTRTNYPLRLDDSLREQVRSRSSINGQTMHEFIEEAIRIHVMTDIAAHTDSEIAPLVAKYIHESQKQFAGSLRKLVARSTLETLRTQHLLLMFMHHAGVTWGQLTTWREQGWRYAVKEIKEEPALDATEAGDEAIEA